MLLTIAFYGFVILTVLYYYRRVKCNNSIHGPKGLPILGNITQLDLGNPFPQFSKWTEEFGSIFQLKLGPKFMVVVSGYDYAYDVFVKKGWDFAGRSLGFRSSIATSGTYGIANRNPDENWRLFRKIAHSSLKQFGPGMGRIEELSIKMTSDLLEAFSAANSESLDPAMEIDRATMKMMLLMVYGEHDEQIVQESIVLNQLGQKLHAGGLSGLLLDVFPWIRFFGNSIYNDFLKLKEMSISIWTDVISKKLPDEEFNVLPIMLALLNQKDQFYLEQPQFAEHFIRSGTSHLISAGNATTSRSFYAFLNILLHYPDVMDKIHGEIDDVLGEKQVGLHHKVDMPYTKAVILELLRYTSIAPTGLVHKALTDTTLGEHQIRKDTLVIVNHWYIHHDESFWQDPYSFIPERFLDADGQLLPADHPNCKHLLPFGAGPRVCVGESMAKARLFLWTVAVLQRFTLKAPEGQDLVPCDPRTYTADLTLKPQPFKVCFIPRK